MDANQNGSATAGDVREAENAADAGGVAEALSEQTSESAAAPGPGAEPSSEHPSPDDAPAEPASPEQAAEDVPQPRSAEPEPAASAETGSAGKSAKKRKAAPKTKTAGTKSLVVFRDGKVHYADETVVVLDLDDAAHPDTDVHDVVDKLSELRDAVESSGRTEAVTLVAELIQAKALA